MATLIFVHAFLQHRPRGLTIHLSRRLRRGLTRALGRNEQKPVRSVQRSIIHLGRALHFGQVFANALCSFSPARRWVFGGTLRIAPGGWARRASDRLLRKVGTASRARPEASASGAGLAWRSRRSAASSGGVVAGLARVSGGDGGLTNRPSRLRSAGFGQVIGGCRRFGSRSACCGAA